MTEADERKRMREALADLVKKAIEDFFKANATEEDVLPVIQAVFEVFSFQLGYMDGLAGHMGIADEVREGIVAEWVKEGRALSQTDLSNHAVNKAGLKVNMVAPRDNDLPN